MKKAVNVCLLLVFCLSISVFAQDSEPIKDISVEIFLVKVNTPAIYANVKDPFTLKEISVLELASYIAADEKIAQIVASDMAEIHGNQLTKTSTKFRTYEPLNRKIAQEPKVVIDYYWIENSTDLIIERGEFFKNKIFVSMLFNYHASEIVSPSTEKGEIDSVVAEDKVDFENRVVELVPGVAKIVNITRNGDTTFFLVAKADVLKNEQQ